LTQNSEQSLVTARIEIYFQIGPDRRSVIYRVRDYNRIRRIYAAFVCLLFSPGSLLSLESAAQVYLFSRTAEAQLIQLLPSERRSNHFSARACLCQCHRRSRHFSFTVQPPCGEQAMNADASDNAQLSFPGNRLDNGLILLEGDFDAISKRIESNSIEFFGHGQLLLTTTPAQPIN